MSDLLDEEVPRMPPLSMATLEGLGEQVLELLYPKALRQPRAVDFLELVDRKLQDFGIYVYPVHADQLNGQEAVTKGAGRKGDDITILVSFDLWNDLIAGGAAANRARATIAHELSHAILHVPVIRRRMATPGGAQLLNRVRRSELRPFEDPEWQAWALAGCIIAPRKTLQMLARPSVIGAAAVYEVSEGMMRSHLKRIHLLRRFS